MRRAGVEMRVRKPLAIELFAGCFGWGRGFVSAGFRVIGFDIEHIPEIHGDVPDGCYLALQDVLTLHGSQLSQAACIVGSPPCQKFSYASMPWKRAKAQVPQILPAWWHKPEPDMFASEIQEWLEWKRENPAPPPSTSLFDACFRIQREASEAAGRYIPLVVENVKGAQPWVGKAKANYGSYYLWGDVAQVGNRVVSAWPKFGEGACPVKATKNNGGSWFAIGSPGQKVLGQNPVCRKVPGLNFHEYEKTGKPGRSFQSAAVDHVKTVGRESDAIKQHGSGPIWFDTGIAKHSSRSLSRKSASAQIAKIPFPLAYHIAQCFKPREKCA